MYKFSRFLIIAIIELGKGRIKIQENIKEKSSPVFLKFGAENCLEHFKVFDVTSVCQQHILRGKL